MNLSRAALYRIVALLTIIVLLGASASQAISEELGPDGWYISVGVGANRASTMKQAGHNRDTTCYPTRDCRRLPGGMPVGYRWFYDLSPDAGIAFELTEIFVTHTDPRATARRAATDFKPPQLLQLVIVSSFIIWYPPRGDNSTVAIPDGVNYGHFDSVHIGAVRAGLRDGLCAGITMASQAT